MLAPTAPTTSKTPLPPPTAAVIEMKPVSVIPPIVSSAWTIALTYTSPLAGAFGLRLPSRPGAAPQIRIVGESPGSSSGRNASGMVKT